MSGSEHQRLDFNVVVSNILRYGVLLSSILIIVGSLLLFFNKSTLGLPTSVQQLLSTNFGRPTLSAGVLIQGIVRLNPLSILALGVLILLATPVVRVAVSILFFAAEKDGTYVLITAFVLLVLICSIFILGPAEGSSG